MARPAAEHAAFEKGGPAGPGLADRLHALLFTAAGPRLRCLVAERADATLVGYATCEPAISTWDGYEYLHMDCLYLRPGHRGLGLGPLLMDAVAAEARALGIVGIQWQTPVWNDGAIRFQRRLGARSKDKPRFTWLASPSGPVGQ
ncbi:GNAT family N-acetyltransferase [Streptomyces sp. NPDC058297]|uniref:GNAT family N-acetyltransferase n=1 Tax=unclassified Streptomyces TaxID=2593676 RepID=UPI0036E96DEB